MINVGKTLDTYVVLSTYVLLIYSKNQQFLLFFFEFQCLSLKQEERNIIVAL